MILMAVGPILLAGAWIVSTLVKIMDAVAITIGVGWIAVGLLSMGLSVQLLQGKVGRNALYGVRFRQSFQSDEAWLVINRYGVKRMMIWALPMIAIGVAVLFFPLQTRPFLALLLGFSSLAFVLIPAIDTWHYARRYSSDR